MIDLLCNVILWIISFLMYAMNDYYWKRCKARCLKTSSNSFYVDFVFILFKVKIVLYYILPSITRFLFQWENDYIDRVMPYEVCIVYVSELAALFVYYLTFLYLLKNNKDNLSFNYSNGRAAVFFAFAILALFSYFTLSKISLLSGKDNPSDDLWMIRPLAVTVGSVLCFYILTTGRKYWPFGIVVFSLLASIIYLVSAFIGGVRSTIFWPVLWLVYCAYYFNKRSTKSKINKRFVLWGVIGLAFMVVLATVQGGMTSTRGSDFVDIAVKMNEINSNKDKGERDFFHEIDFRFGAPTHYSVGFFRMYNSEESAGLNPIINSLYSPIPRAFLPNKPVPCSVDGDIYGMGMYKTYEKIRPGYANMSDFSTAAHAYWELGVLGIIIFSITPAIYVFLSIKLFRKFDILGPCFFLAIFKPWGYNEPKIWVSEIVLQLSQVILVSFVLLVIYKKLKRNLG